MQNHFFSSGLSFITAWTTWRPAVQVESDQRNVEVLHCSPVTSGAPASVQNTPPLRLTAPLMARAMLDSWVPMKSIWPLATEALTCRMASSVLACVSPKVNSSL